jgi:hypothetical protein
MRTAKPSRHCSGEPTGFVSSDVHTAAREPSATVTIAGREPCNYAILTGDFDKLRRGEEVYYVEDVGDTGPMATKVWVKGG